MDDTSQSEVHRQVTIVNRQGLHARPVMQFVDLACRFDCSVKLCKDDQTVDGKSPMEMMLLAAAQGTRLDLVVTGNGADEVAETAEALVKLIESGFGED